MNDISFNYEYNFDKLDKLATSVVKLLNIKGVTISVAESCTGGLMAETITGVSGASSVFELGLCTYSNRMKMKYLNVPELELNEFSAVSSQVALSMVKGLIQCSNANICVSFTGFAGPDGGTKENPVGTVYIGFSFDGICSVERLDFSKLENFNRGNVRKSAVIYALQVVEKKLVEENNE